MRLFSYSLLINPLLLTQVTEPLTMNVVIFLPAIIMGIIGGIFGAIFTRLNALIVTIRKKIIKKIGNKTIKGLARTLECVILVVSFD